MDMTDARQATDPRVADLVQAGKVLVALYVPQYTKDPVTGELGGWCVDLIHALGARIGVKGVPVEHPNPANALTSAASGACNATIIGFEASRATKIDYAPPIVEADYTIMAPAGSAYRTLAEADRPGVRIAAVRDHASTMALSKLIRHATFVYADMPDPTFEILRRGEADLFASLDEVLRHYAAQWPGAQVWPGRYGFNSIGFAVPKGQPGRLAFVSEFGEEAKSSGLVQQALDRSGWSGVHVARSAAT
jgi:polar amino acid transport system substrate-binding protein